MFNQRAIIFLKGRAPAASGGRSGPARAASGIDGQAARHGQRSGRGTLSSSIGPEAAHPEHDPDDDAEGPAARRGPCVVAHKFKHTGVSVMGEHNAPLTLIQGQARHAHVSTTARYIHVDEDTHAEKAAAFYAAMVTKRPPAATNEQSPASGPTDAESRFRDKIETNFRDNREIAPSRIQPWEHAGGPRRTKPSGRGPGGRRDKSALLRRGDPHFGTCLIDRVEGSCDVD
ncbi:hypothetical protein OV203_20290 [Nannocystis sp. ILAH1]|uniref:hypothetical protein n=1 Tax=Nannocystis sp. ILAH1 TaxID=2996789 RepID=UPI00227023F0|nr:hypothetical protein [Nannocystis sp. ILAH1]MCY0989491.1 hypothetical protein [Nannocystis sp. ILAH1]